MKIANLGTLAGPVIAYGGAFGNLAALGALWREAGRAGVPPGRVICTGDVVGLAAQAADCVAATRAYASPVVAGNAERQLAAGSAGPAAGFPRASRAGALMAPAWRHTEAALDRAARDWMEGLPDLLVLAHEGRRCAVVHGGATDPGRLLWPGSPEAAFREQITAIAAAAGPVDLVIAGHCGFAFERVVAGVHWINAGAIGLPPNDGRRGGRYLRLDADGARLLRLDYDPRPAFAAMVAAGLTQGWDLALMTGRWPADDHLPPEMRAPA